MVHHVNDIEMKTPEFLNISLPNLRDIFVSASIARIISQLKLGQVNNMKFKSTRSFNGKSLGIQWYLTLNFKTWSHFFIIIFSCISKCFSMHGGNDTSKSVIGIVWPSNTLDFCQLLISIRTITNVTLRYRQKYQINLYWPHSTTVRSDQIFTKGSKIFCSYSWWVLESKKVLRNQSFL